MQPRLKEFLKLAAIPIALLLILLSVILFYKILGIHPREGVLEIAREYFATYGYLVVFIGALVEGLLFLNWYLPGSAVIVLGVILAGRNPLEAAFVVSLVIAAFFITSIINYLIGRYGWYRLFLKLGLKKPLEKIKNRVEKHGLTIIFSTYLHPNIGALTATSAGILHLPFKKFALYSALALIAWDTLWGVVVYVLGDYLLNFLGVWFILTFASLWLIVVIVKFFSKKKGVPVNIP